MEIKVNVSQEQIEEIAAFSQKRHFIKLLKEELELPDRFKHFKYVKDQLFALADEVYDRRDDDVSLRETVRAVVTLNRPTVDKIFSILEECQECEECYPDEEDEDDETPHCIGVFML